MQQQNASQLEAAQLQFMEQQCMLSTLRGLLCELQADRHSDQGHQEGDGASQSVDAPYAAAVASLSKHLQAAALAQQLALPDTAAQTNPFSTLQQHKDSSCSSSETINPARSELLGTVGHIAGVTPQQIRQLYIPSRKAAQRAHTPVLPLLEKRIKQRVQAAVAAIAGPGDDEYDTPSSALQKIKDMQAAVSNLKQSSMQHLQQLHTEATEYLQELDNIHAVLQQLVGNCMLLEQPKIAQAHRERLQIAIDNARIKLTYMHQVLYKDTYDPSTVQALRAISQEQQQLEQELNSSIKQAQAELTEYEQQGSDFGKIVQDYADLQAKVQDMDNVMATLTQVEDDIWNA